MIIKTQKGFSLIELLIVVVIIGIIAAIAIPNLMAARRTANEASAITTIRTVFGAQMTYAATVGQGSYAGNMSGGNGVVGLAAQNLVDSTVATGQKAGYTIVTYATPRTTTQYATLIIGASPLTTSGATQTGTRVFLCATNGVIYTDSIGGSMTWDNSGAPITITGGNPL